MPRILETLLALGLAASFALVAEVLLARRSRTIFEWTESFLIGLGVCATLLFPLTLIFRRNALVVLAALIAAGALAGLVKRFRRTSGKDQAPPENPPARSRFDALSAVFVGLIVLVAGAFAALNWRYAYLWDGFQVWAARAQVLYHQGGLAPVIAPREYLNRIMNYPPAVPLYEALLWLVRGRFDWDAVKPIFLVFYAAMVLGTYRAAAAVAPRRLALAATALLCLLPAVSTRWSAGGYADMPEAAYVAGVAAAFLNRKGAAGWRSPLPWLIGSLAVVKSEGLLLSLLCCAVALVLAVSHRQTAAARSNGRLKLLAVAPAILMIELRLAFLAWIHYPDRNYVPINPQNLLRAASRFPEVVRHAARELIHFNEWGLFWIAFFLATILLFFRSSVPRELRALAAATGLALLTYAGIFLFSTWPVALHVQQAFPRLLQQLAPAAAVVIIAGYRHVSARPSAGATVSPLWA